MSGRMNRVKDALASTLAMVKTKCMEHPNPYIVGYHNGLSLADHYINARSGAPLMLDMKEFKVQNAPKAVQTPEPTNVDMQEYEGLVDKILSAARELELPPESNLGRAFKDLDAFVDSKLEGATIVGTNVSPGAVADPL